MFLYAARLSYLHPHMYSFEEEGPELSSRPRAVMDLALLLSVHTDKGGFPMRLGFVLGIYNSVLDAISHCSVQYLQNKYRVKANKDHRLSPPTRHPIHRKSSLVSSCAERPRALTVHDVPWKDHAVVEPTHDKRAHAVRDTNSLTLSKRTLPLSQPKELFHSRQKPYRSRE